MWHVEVDGQERLFCDPEDNAMQVRAWINKALDEKMLKRRHNGNLSHMRPAQALIINAFNKV